MLDINLSRPEIHKGLDPDLNWIKFNPSLKFSQGPYTEKIDLCFEPVFLKEIMRVIEWLQEIKTADKWETTLLYISSNTRKYFFLTQCKLIINNVDYCM